PVVLDADALNVLAAMRDALPALLPAGRPTVLTPHPKEFARLAGVEMADVLAEPEAVGRAFLRDKPGVTLVLKSHRTLVLQRDEPVWASPHPGNGGLAKGGTGDVLT